MKYFKTLGLALILVLFPASSVFAQEASDKGLVVPIADDGVQRVEITGGSYYFSPDHLVVKVNVPVEFIVKKEGKKPHSIAMKAPEAGMEFSEKLGSKPISIRFTPTKTGKFPFWCTKKFPFMKSHKDRGMQGVLEVVD